MTVARYDDLAEYVSRQARLRLVELCLAAIEKQMQELKETGPKIGRPPGATAILGDRLGVTQRNVNRWLEDKFQAKNIKAKMILSLALELDPEGMKRILIADLERHKQELSYLVPLEDEEARKDSNKGHPG